MRLRHAKSERVPPPPKIETEIGKLIDEARRLTAVLQDRLETAAALWERQENERE